ncbi:hypothetical protein OH492_16015 [Vibrio chagasii]|nr:hypothetical protein [Vibrio chagasii]
MLIDGWCCLMTLLIKGQLLLTLQSELGRLNQYGIKLQQSDSHWSIESQLMELKTVLMSLASSAENMKMSN